jgi:homoserine dehydrogenase
MLGAESLPAKIEGVYNAIQLIGDAVGDVVLSGRGAGDPRQAAQWSATSSPAPAIFSRASGSSASCLIPARERRPLRLRPMEEIRSLYYLRHGH